MSVDAHQESSKQRELARAGDVLARKKGYALGGLEGIYKYLIEKHHWTPSQLREMTVDDLHLCMDRRWPKGAFDDTEGADD